MAAIVSLGAVNASAAEVDENPALVSAVAAAEAGAAQEGIIEQVEVSQPEEAEIFASGVKGSTGFGDISVSFDDAVDLEAVGNSDYAADAEFGAVAKAASEVGTLLQKIEVEEKERTVETVWDLSMPQGVEAVAFEDGSIGFRMDNGDGVSVVSETVISALWAVDDEGNPLKTWYEVDPEVSSIIQIVDTADVSGEVVVDPRITYGKGVYFNWFGAELRSLKAAGSAGIALAIGYGCAQAGKLRNPALIAVVGTICMVTGGTVGLNSLKVALSNVKQIFDNTCYQWKVGDYRIKVVPSKGNCSVI